MPEANETIEDRFNRLASAWRDGCGPHSSIERLADHPAHREIVAMGMPVVPYILRSLQRNPDHWYYALHLITGDNPVKEQNRGRIARMAEDWIEWGRERGLLLPPVPRRAERKAQQGVQ